MKTRADLRIIGCRYWNANGSAVSIVARQGMRGDDWAAYIGATGSAMSEEETHEWVAEMGCKLDEHIARAIWPEFADMEYRQ